MADIQRIEDALVAADKAGDHKTAKFLTDEIIRMRQPEQEPGRVATAADQFLHDVTYGFSDEVGAAGAATGKTIGRVIKGDPIQPGQDFDESLEEERGALRRYGEQSPIASTLSGLAGGVVGGGAVLKGARGINTAQRSTPRIIGRGAVEGGGLGAAHGFGSGEGVLDRLERAGYGGVGGGLLGAGVAGIAGRMGSRNAPKPPTTGQLKTESQMSFKAAEDVGAVVTAQSFDDFVDDLARATQKSGLRPKIQKESSAALDEFVEMAATKQGMTFEELNEMRQVLGAVAGSVKPAERRMASIMIDKLDDYMAGLKPADILSGDAPAAVESLRNARDMWSRVKKSETLERLVERAYDRGAAYSGSGFENALRNEFKSLLLNDRKMRGFSKIEEAAIRRVVRGGPVESVLRWIGKAAPTGIISGALGSGAGYAMGGPIGAAALPAAGFVGRAGAGALTRNNARIAMEATRRGSPGIRSALTPRQDALIRALTAGGASEAPNMHDALPGLLRGRRSVR